MKRGGIEVGQLQEGQTLTSLISPRVHILKHDQHATYSGVVCVPFQGKEDFLSLGTSCYTSKTITLPEHVYHKQHILYKYSSLHTQFLLFKVCVISPSLIIFFLCCCSWSLRSLQCKTLQASNFIVRGYELLVSLIIKLIGKEYGATTWKFFHRI